MTRCICSTAYGYTSAVRKTTRTVENGCQTKFSEGGACGLYVVRGTQTVYSNVKLTAERDADTGGLVWKTESPTPLAGGLLVQSARIGFQILPRPKLCRIDKNTDYHQLILFTCGSNE